MPPRYNLSQSPTHWSVSSSYIWPIKLVFLWSLTHPLHMDPERVWQVDQAPLRPPPHLQLSPAQKASVPPGLVSSFNLSHPKPRTVTGSSLASYSPHLQCSLPLRLYPWLLPCETLPLAATVPDTTVISCPSFYTPDATFSNVSILKPSLDMHVQLATRALHLRESQEHRRLLSTAKN